MSDVLGSGGIALPDESLPEGAVVDAASLERDGADVTDFVVVGSGAAGAVAAHALARTGATVALVEEGPWVKTHEFGDGVYDAFQRMFRDGGTQVMDRSFVPILQGRCVGGSTVMNSAIAHRLPEDVADDWAKRFGLGGTITVAALEPHFDALERELQVHAVADEALGENNRLFLDEARAEGLPARRMQRFEHGCRGSARCLTGCPNGAKRAMNLTYVPWALAHGARIYTSCRAERVVVERGRATGVVAVASHAGAHGRRVHLRARRAVLVAASTVQTPDLLRRSGVRSGALGQHFQCHPGYAIGGLFDADVAMTFGATQGAESTHLRLTDRIKLETLSMPPELAAVRIPGVGHELMERFGAFAHLAVWAVVVRAEAEGTVRSTWRGRDRVCWVPAPADLERTRRGVALLARMMFEAGAREVWPGLYGLPPALRSIDEVRLIDEVPLDTHLFGYVTSHLFGAARMGSDPRSSVVGTDFAVHALPNLYVVDSSVFPTNLGVNPQHTIMAMSRLAATRIADRGERTHRAA
jgi:choline dehydrogenase-like flavoprotein